MKTAHTLAIVLSTFLVAAQGAPTLPTRTSSGDLVWGPSSSGPSFTGYGGGGFTQPGTLHRAQAIGPAGSFMASPFAQEANRPDPSAFPQLPGAESRAIQPSESLMNGPFAQIAAETAQGSAGGGYLGGRSSNPISTGAAPLQPTAPYIPESQNSGAPLRGANSFPQGNPSLASPFEQYVADLPGAGGPLQQSPTTMDSPFAQQAAEATLGGTGGGYIGGGSSNPGAPPLQPAGRFIPGANAGYLRPAADDGPFGRQAAAEGVQPAVGRAPSGAGQGIVPSYSQLLQQPNGELDPTHRLLQRPPQQPNTQDYASQYALWSRNSMDPQYSGLGPSASSVDRGFYQDLYGFHDPFHEFLTLFV